MSEYVDNLLIRLTKAVGWKKDQIMVQVHFILYMQPMNPPKSKCISEFRLLCVRVIES
jgi:hypothetical protein